VKKVAEILYIMYMPFWQDFGLQDFGLQCLTCSVVESVSSFTVSAAFRGEWNFLFIRGPFSVVASLFFTLVSWVWEGIIVINGRRAPEWRGFSKSCRDVLWTFVGYFEVFCGVARYICLWYICCEAA
jgi:hypothetical protein